MKKNFILDTNVLIHCPDAIMRFEDNNIFICGTVIEELDNHKKDSGERGYNVRHCLKNIKEMIMYSDDVNKIELPNGGTLFLTYNPVSKVKTDFVNENNDNKILSYTLSLMADASLIDNDLPETTILVTNDVGMMIKAIRLGIPTQEYKNDRLADISQIYTGREIINVSDDEISEFFKKREMKTDEEFTENQFIRIVSYTGSSALGKYKNKMIVELEHLKDQPCDLTARNEGQRFLQESLMTDYNDIPLTICNGPAGTGKTLFALACGLQQVMEEHRYKRVLICRPNIMMEEEIGFLPGSEADKIFPLLRGVMDNLEVIFKDKDDTPAMIKDKIEELFDRGYIKAEAIGYLRGRSITDTFIIIDEAQNTTPTQILSIITRAGERSKIVVLGDINQIDNPRLDKGNNGLTFAIEHMKGSRLCEITSFSENECTRSALAKEASDKLRL